ncbi:Alpha/Beta hydrolase protein [Abortiporus biennis]|nr:Alpha/Beta hydrolase protein [Abortiporus biennis]
MIDHILGRPSPSWKRFQVFFVIFFWLWRILHGDPNGPRVLWLRKANRILKRFTPWQLIVSTLTGVYAARNLDKILGLGAPEPLAQLYSPSYYRATWISTGLDAGFATAMTIRPKWLRDICSVLFSVYYIIYASEADEKLRRFRAVPTVEMLRTTWEKTTNPYIRALTYYPPITIRKKLLIPRPADAPYQRPVTAWLFFAPPEHHLSRATDLILDFPGGGFISMTPEHHEDRLRMWAMRTGKPVLSIDYGKAPEYPYPFAIDECFDAYRMIVESAGTIIGMSGTKLNVVFSGDSAGAHVAVSVMIKILETQILLPRPLALVLNYPALDFNFTSWMSPANLRVLQSEQSSGNLPGLAEQKDHFGHISPLSMIGDRKTLHRRRSWKDTFRNFAAPLDESPSAHHRSPRILSKHPKSVKEGSPPRPHSSSSQNGDEAGTMADEEDGADLSALPEEDMPLEARVRFNPIIDQIATASPQKEISEISAQPGNANVETPLGTRLTMTSRTGYFQDRIISPSMMRAMAILYIGPHRNPDFANDYHLSPILAPSHLLAQLPPLLMSCGEKDPFVDDTVIFAGRVREAKRARRTELDGLLSAGRTSKFGEHLRMSSHESGRDDSTRQMKHELDELASQRDEDWVRMQIFSDWSHGYLQMPMLIREARTVIYDLADWIDEIFAGRVEHPSTIRHGTLYKTDRSRFVIPASEEGYSSLASDTETDDILTFAPKRRSPPASFSTSDGKATSSPRPSHSRSTSKDQTIRPTISTALSNETTVRKQQGLLGVGQPDASSLALIGFNAPGITSERGTPCASDSAGSNVHPPMPTVNSSRTGTPGKLDGQTITESELMRRRRLLDSHLIPSSNGDNGCATKLN